MKILLVEDDPDLGYGLVSALKSEHFIVFHASRAKDAIRSLDSFHPDMMILDLGLPDLDGLDVLKIFRQRKLLIPTLVLTARVGVDDKVNTLDSGADDYLAKPFEMRELLARLRVMSRRLGTASTSKITIGVVELDASSHTLCVSGESVCLPKKEYMTLKILMEEAGRVKTKSMLENHLYEWGEVIGSNTVEVHISNLRKKLPKNFIQTIRGVGYTIKQPD